jgi:hypothetical protein
MSKRETSLRTISGSREGYSTSIQLLMAPFPRSLHCRGSVCYLRYFCRARDAGGMPLHDPNRSRAKEPYPKSQFQLCAAEADKKAPSPRTSDPATQRRLTLTIACRSPTFYLRWGWSSPKPPARADDSYRETSGGSPSRSRRRAAFLLPVLAPDDCLPEA